jgi:hypothetical protein
VCFDRFEKSKLKLKKIVWTQLRLFRFDDESQLFSDPFERSGKAKHAHDEFETEANIRFASRPGSGGVS